MENPFPFLPPHFVPRIFPSEQRRFGFSSLSLMLYQQPDGGGKEAAPRGSVSLSPALWEVCTASASQPGWAFKFQLPEPERSGFTDAPFTVSTSQSRAGTALNAAAPAHGCFGQWQPTNQRHRKQTKCW
jgi:hypothetical protein